MASRSALFLPSPEEVEHLVEIRAGKMYQKGRTVYADVRKGLIFIYQSDDSLVHFCWRDRTTGLIEDDLIIFPNECNYERVPQCVTGRVYLLRFKNSKQRYFFWLQEPKTEFDDEHCNIINQLLTNPPNNSERIRSRDREVQAILSNMSHAQFLQLIGSASLTELSFLLDSLNRATPTPTTSRRAIEPEHHHKVNTPVLSRTEVDATPGRSQVASMQPSISSVTLSRHRRDKNKSQTNPRSLHINDEPGFSQEVTQTVIMQDPPVDLSTAFTSDVLTPLLSEPEAVEHLQNYLPEVGPTPEEGLYSTINSVHFQQAVRDFSRALDSGQLEPLLHPFSLSADALAAADRGDIEGFFIALQRDARDPDGTTREE